MNHHLRDILIIYVLGPALVYGVGSGANYLLNHDNGFLSFVGAILCIITIILGLIVFVGLCAAPIFYFTVRSTEKMEAIVKEIESELVATELFNPLEYSKEFEYKRRLKGFKKRLEKGNANRDIEDKLKVLLSDIRRNNYG